MYIDEVGNSDTGTSLRNPNHRHLSLTGIVFELEYVKDSVFPIIEELKADYFNSHPDTPIVLHRKELVNRKFPFNVLQNPETESAFNADLLRTIEVLDYAVLTVVIDKWDHIERYQEWARHPYHYCLKVLLERYTRWLERQSATGDVMAESRGKREDTKLKAEFAHIWEWGTEWILATRVQKQLTSRQLKIKPKDANVCGLQFADLLAHPSYKAVVCRRQRRNFPDNFGGKIATILETSKYDRSPAGRIDGDGTKWLP